jgi:hypothetical protein
VYRRFQVDASENWRGFGVPLRTVVATAFLEVFSFLISKLILMSVKMFFVSWTRAAIPRIVLEKNGEPATPEFIQGGTK